MVVSHFMIYFIGINGERFWNCQLSRQHTGTTESDINDAPCTINVPHCIKYVSLFVPPSQTSTWLTGNKSHQENLICWTQFQEICTNVKERKNNPNKILRHILLRPNPFAYCSFCKRIFRKNLLRFLLTFFCHIFSLNLYSIIFS
jgi:hypothetical protein